jgi:Phage tail lysozyme/Phage-related minor tail protein
VTVIGSNVGTAYIDILPNPAGFEAALQAENDAMFGNLKKDAATAGEDAGANLRTGMRDEAGRLEGDLGEVGLASGSALRSGVKDGTAGLEGDLASAGALGGARLRDGAKEGAKGLESDMADLGGLAGGNLRRGVEDETGKLADDVEKDGSKAGERLSKGIGSGLSKLADLAANTGLPIGGLSSKLDEASKSLQDTDHKSSSLGESLDHLGGYALLGVGAAAAVAVVGTTKLAEGMQKADATIAGAEGTSQHFATTVGNEFLKTGASAEFTGKQMAMAFGEVAGQLKATEGHALSSGESLKFQSAAATLAEAKQIQLGEATGATAKILQAFELDAGQSAHVTDVLFQASNATGQSVEGLATQLTKVRSKLGETSGSVGELSGLLVDMTDHGITGRSAMTGLNTGLNTLLKTSDGVATAVGQQNSAYAAMDPQLKVLAKAYQDGSVSSKQFKEQTEGLPPEQAALAENFAKASTAVQTAQLKYKEMGLTVFDAQGKFVGMGSIIDQLGPRFAKMTEQQQLASAATIFGAGAARQMVAVIDAGPEAYAKATAAVEKHGAAEVAAREQAKTLSGEEKEISKDAINLATSIGEVLIPIITKMVGAFVTATTFVLAHKVVLIGLAAVVTGVLGTAIAVFTVNKMKAFGESFVKAGQTLGLFSEKAAATATDVEGSMTAQEAATERMAATTATASGQMELDFEGVGTAAGTAATEVGTAAGAIEGADATLVASNEAVGASFAAWLGPLALATAALYGIVKAEEAVIGGHIGELLGGNQPGEKSKEGEAYGGLKSKPSGTVQGVYGGLQQLGLGSNEAAGITAVLGGESGLSPTATGSEGAFGLAQWLGSRLSGLAQFASGKHESDSSVKAQLEYLVHELHGGEAGTQAKLEGAKTPQEAAAIFVKEFERPAAANIPSVLDRAKSYYPHEAAAAGTPKLESVIPANTHAVEGLTKAIAPTGTATKGSSAVSPEKAAEAQEKAARKAEETDAKAKKAEEAAKKAALDKEVAGQEKQLTAYTQRALAEEAKVGTVRRAYIEQELSEHKKYIATVIAEEKKGLTTKQAEEHAKTKQEVLAQEAGEKERSKLQAAVTSGSLATLNKTLTEAHQGALGKLDSTLNLTHKAALEKLSSELVATWNDAEAKQLALQQQADAEQAKKAAEATEKSDKEAAEQRQREQEAGAANDAQKAKEREEWSQDVEKARLAEIQKQSTIEGDKASAQAQEIGDATKVMLDKQAEVGLSGTAEISAHLQTVFDEVTGQMDSAINAAKLAQDEQAGKGAVAEAEAAARTARVESEAKVKEAQAQRELEVAKAQANAPQAGAAVNIESLMINAAGMSSADILNELAWSLKTGGLPVAQPTAP